MKKLMFATVAMAAGFAMAAGEITSKNVVGYMTRESTTKAPSYGPMFAKPATDGATYKLADFTAEGMSDAGDDYIQFLDPNDAHATVKAMYVPESSYGKDWAGWWTPDWENLDDQEFPAGTAFLGFIGSGNTVTFRFAGEVENGRTIVTTTKAPFIANPTPVDLKLKDITAEGMSDAGDDYIQFLDPNDAHATIKAMYVPESSYGKDWAGWWTPDWENLDDTPVPAGAGFLGFIGSGNTVTFVFPDPLKAK